MAVALVALGLRLALIDVAGFWRDEIPSLTAAAWPLPDILFARFGEIRNQPPLHYLLIRAGLALAGPPGGPLSAEAAARLPFALAGVAGCYLTVRAGRRWFGEGAGLLAGLFLAGSFGALAQADEARPYALLSTCALAALLALDRALAGGPGAGRAWAGAVLAGLAGVASSYLMLTAVLPGLALYAGWRLRHVIRQAVRGPERAAAGRALRAPLGAGAVLAAGSALALPDLLAIGWAGKAPPDQPLDALVKLLLYNGLSFGPAPAAPWAIGLAALALGGSVWAARGTPATRRGLLALGVLAGWGLLALPLSGPSELVAPRYWSFSYPPLCLPAGAGLAAILGLLQGSGSLAGVAGGGVGDEPSTNVTTNKRMTLRLRYYRFALSLALNSACRYFYSFIRSVFVDGLCPDSDPPGSRRASWTRAWRVAGARGPAPAVARAALVLLAFSGVPGVLAALAAQAVPPGTPPHPDYRAAARFLARTARPGDLVAIVDEPEYGWRVCDWYWRTGPGLAPGVVVTDAADPRLGDLVSAARIYWLVAAADPAFLAAVAAAPPAGTAVVLAAPQVLVLREVLPAPAPPAARLAALATALARRAPPGPAPRFLDVAQGAAAEARGDLPAAVAWDRRAGPFRALGAEHLANAAGFLARGAPARALIDLAAARALEPANPAIYAAAAPLLVAAGALPAAARERALAHALSNGR